MEFNQVQSAQGSTVASTDVASLVDTQKASSGFVPRLVSAFGCLGDRTAVVNQVELARADTGPTEENTSEDSLPSASSRSLSERYLDQQSGRLFRVPLVNVDQLSERQSLKGVAGNNAVVSTHVRQSGHRHHYVVVQPQDVTGTQVAIPLKLAAWAHKSMADAFDVFDRTGWSIDRVNKFGEDVFQIVHLKGSEDASDVVELRSTLPTVGGEHAVVTVKREHSEDLLAHVGQALDDVSALDRLLMGMHHIVDHPLEMREEDAIRETYFNQHLQAA